ncbi:NHL repeat-containing protein, partial [bacterium]|nr:NHL repeat-containing protein [bacterium]
NRIVKLDTKGKYVNHVGGFGWKNNQFDSPVDIFAVDGLNIYVADLNNQRIQRYSKKLEYVTSFGESKLTELSIDASRTSNEPLGFPSGLAVSSQGDLFYSDSENDQIVKINRFGKKETAFGGFSEGRGTLRSPGKVFVTSRFVYVIDENRVVVFDYYGNYIRDIGA